MNTKRKISRFLDMKARVDNRLCDSLNVFRGDCNKSVLYSRGKKTDKFFTEDSKLYITPKEVSLMRDGVKLNRKIGKWDNLSSRVVVDFVRYRPKKTSLLLDMLERRYEMMQEHTKQATENLIGNFSLLRLWNLSIVGSILFGMVTMTFVYRYLGQGAVASADDSGQFFAQEQQIVNPGQGGKILAMEDNISAGDVSEETFSKQVEEIQKASDRAALEQEIYGMVKGYPIEKMVPYIAQQDRTVAAFMIAIAKKESNWGRRVPVLDGQDCYNYVGYRGQRERMGTGGHTCFDSPEDAVNTIAKRVKTLVEDNNRNTPEKMVIWKCGQSCEATGGQAAANKWISDVDMYFQKFKT